MSNSIGEVQVQAAGKTWTLRLCNSTLIRLQGAPELGFSGTDEEFMSWLGDKMERLVPKAWPVILRHALAKHHPDVTDEQASDLLTEIGSHRFAGLFMEALRWALPPEPAKEKAKGKADAPSTGATS